MRGARRELLQNMAFNCVSHCSLFVSYELFKSLSSLQRARPSCPSSSVVEEEAVQQKMGVRGGTRQGKHNSADQASSAQEGEGDGAVSETEERGDYAAMWHYMAVASAGAGAGIVQVRGFAAVEEVKEAW